MDFREMTQRDAESCLALELDKLARTEAEGRRQTVDREFDGFKKLFGKFINEKGPSVIWDKIERLHQDAVSSDTISQCCQSILNDPLLLRYCLTPP